MWVRGTGRFTIKVMQELLRHASSRVIMDRYTQAVTAQERAAQSGVVRLFRVRANGVRN